MSGLAVELRDLSKVFDASKGPDYEVAAVRHVTLGIHPGEFFTLLGPSGCGKTTTLRIIGGFEEPTEGEVTIEGQSMAGVPPYRRPVNIVFQNYALFPHLTVEQNVAFGPSIKGMPKDEKARRVREALALVRLPNVGDRSPGQLSGGQQQRVALARALINDPKVLLLDEPLGALDLKLRKQMQIELKHIQQQVGITFVYVTHDQEEALTMSDRIAVMNEGELLQVGDPVSIYERPCCRFVADFIGETNFIKAHVLGVEANRVCLSVAGEKAWSASADERLVPGQEVLLAVRPEKVDLLPAEKANGTSLSGVVRETVYIGTDTRFVIALASGETLVARLQNIGEHGLGEFRPGDAVKVVWAADDARPLTG